jgi:hypothetical protein
MTFESYDMKVAQPLDPYQIPRYNDLADESMEKYTLDKL